MVSRPHSTTGGTCHHRRSRPALEHTAGRNCTEPEEGVAVPGGHGEGVRDLAASQLLGKRSDSADCMRNFVGECAETRRWGVCLHTL